MGLYFNECYMLKCFCITLVIVTMPNNTYTIFYICTMLLEEIKGFYHGILLVGSYTMLCW